MSWYFLNISQIAQRDDFPKIVLKETRQLPVFPIDFNNVSQEKNYATINELVEKIISVRLSDPQADTDGWEKEIDKIIYELYDFTEEERNILENASSN